MSDDPNQAMPPQPEELQAKAESVETSADAPDASADSVAPKVPPRPRVATYRPNHRATFIGIGIVVLILGINAVAINFLMNSQNEPDKATNRKDVTLSTKTLDSLGVSRNPVGLQGTQLTIGPDTQFNGKLDVGGDVTVLGSLKLKKAFSAPEGSFATLKAGKVAFSSVNINGDASVSNLIARKNVTIAGTTRLQGPVTITQLTSIANSMNVSGNLAVGGVLSVRGFQANSLTSTSTITIGGHIITRGARPDFSPGTALGYAGTASLSGNDAAGTITISVGSGGGAGNGLLGSVTFASAYPSTPHVLVSPFNKSPGDFYVVRSTTGFSVYTSSTLSYGSYGFDYFVTQ
ncbi:hypothetical protein KBD87_00475 [Candidatus Saccharibacteria bacterium]|nr:hypothetical protein [Candidatus Saccharibacteria bacterium]